MSNHKDEFLLKLHQENYNIERIRGLIHTHFLRVNIDMHICNEPLNAYLRKQTKEDEVKFLILVYCSEY